MDSVRTALLFKERKKKICGETVRKIINSGANMLFLEGNINPYIEILYRGSNILASGCWKKK